MSSAVQTMQLQIERLQEEIANTLNTEKIRKTREHEKAHLAEPNMEFMKGVLDKTSALREYYDAPDPTMHWLHYAPGAHAKGTHFQSKYPAMVEWRERTTPRQIEIRSEYRQCDRGRDRRGAWDSERIEPQRRASYQPPTEEDIAFNAALEKELREFQLAEQEIQERERQEIVNITTISGRKPPRHILGIVPAETDIKFLESVYNMFNIQSEQIKALEVEIQELKKINRLFHQHSQKN